MRKCLKEVIGLLRRRRRNEKRIRTPFLERLGSAFENGPDSNVLINALHYILIIVAAILGAVFVLVVIPVIEGISRIKKAAMAPFRRNTSPPSDGSAP